MILPTKTLWQVRETEDDRSNSVWDVCDDSRQFTAYHAEDGEWLCETLNAIENFKVKAEKYEALMPLLQEAIEHLRSGTNEGSDTWCLADNLSQYLK